MLFKYNLSKEGGSKGKWSLIKKYLYVGFVKNQVKKGDRFMIQGQVFFDLSLSAIEISYIDYVK